MRGLGVPQDPQKAMRLWRTGAENGFALCMVNYAKALEGGALGTPDPAGAKKWFQEAAAAGNEEAIAWCRDNKVSFR
jgi:TPR repeat protein